MMPIDVQIYLFLVCMLIGFSIRIILELYFRIIVRCKLKYCFRIMIEVVILFIFSIISFRIIYNINYGIIPFYCYIIIGIGILFGGTVINDDFGKQINMAIDLLIIIYKYLVKSVYWLFVEPYKKAYNLAKDIGDNLEPIIKKKYHKLRKKWRNRRAKNTKQDEV